MIVRVSVESNANNGLTRNLQRAAVLSSEGINGVDPPLALLRSRRIKLCANLVILLAVTGILAIQQEQFSRNDWSRKCDFQQKVWATVSVACLCSRSLLRVFFALLPPDETPIVAGSARLAHYCRRLIVFLIALLGLFQLAWFIRGAVLLFMRDGDFDLDTCPPQAWIWSLVLWSLEALRYTMPCLVIILLVPCVMIWLGFIREEDDGSANRTPSDVLSKLRRLTYGELQAEGFGGAMAPIDTDDYSAPIDRSPSGVGGANLLDALPDVMGVTHLLTRFGSRSGVGGTTSVPSRSALVANENMCAICFADYEEHECVIQLPCDRRHFFHENCLTQWLERNQKCPMCRRNLVDLINEQNLP